MRPHAPTLLLSLLLAFACTSLEPSPRPLDTEEAALVRAAWWAVETGGPGAAEKVDALLVAHPDSVDGRRLRQNLRLRSDEGWRIYEGARRASESAPDDPEALYLMARLVPDRHLQRDLFLRCVRLDPSFFHGHYGHAVASRELGEGEAAIRSARRALVVRPGHADATLVLAEALGPAPEAEALLDALLTERPGFTRARLAAAARHRRRGDAGAALTVLLDGVDGSAASARLCLSAADMIFDGRVGAMDMERAETVAREVLRRTPGSTSGNLLLAAVLEQPDPGSALEAFSRAVRGGASASRAAEAMFECAVLSGDFRRAERIWARTIPWDLVDVEENEHRGAVGALRSALERAAADRAPESLLLLASALSANGFGGLSVRIAGRARDALPGNAAAAELADRLTAWDAFLRDIKEKVESSYERRRREEESSGFADLLVSLREASVRRLGIDAFAGIEGMGFAFLGEVLRTDEEGAPGIWAEHGTLFVVGQRSGGPVEATTLRIVGRFRERSEEGVPYDLVLGQGQSLRAFREDGGARIAGFTLPGWVVLNLDVVNRWDERMRARARNAREEGLWPAQDAESRRSLWFPGDVVGRIAGLHYAKDRPAASVMSSLTHECGHVVDLSGYFPLILNLPQALVEFAFEGFSPSRIEIRLERTAEEWALLTAPSPRNALMNTLGFLPYSNDTPPHSVAYGEIMAELIETLDEEPDRFPSIDREYNLLQQLDRLSDAELRDLIDRTLR